MATRRRGSGEGSIYQRDEGTWTGAIDFGWVDGKRRRKVVYGTTQSEVVSKLKKLHTQLDAGLPLPDDQITVSELMERWLSDVVVDRVSPNTVSNYRAVATRHIIPTLGRTRLAKLTPFDVQRLMRSKLDSGLSPRTVRLIRGVLVQAIGQAERWGLVGRNVAALTDGPRLSQKEGRALTPLQARQLLEASEGHRLEACFVLMLALGLRRGEALGLPWKSVDLKRGVIKINQALKRENGSLLLGEVKTRGSRRSMNLPVPLIQILRNHQARQADQKALIGEGWQDNGLVFTTSLGTPIDPDNFRHYFSALTRKAGLGHWHPHELRHSAASIM